MIFLRQYQKVYDKYFLAVLKLGRIPSLTEVTELADGRLPDVAEPFKPIYRFKPQATRSVFDIKRYNRAVDDIVLDLEILYDEFSLIQLDNAKRIIHADVYNRLHRHELNRLTRELDSLLFALEGADDNFFAQFENFDDTSKVNLLESTNNIVDLNEGALSLPINLQGSLKLSLSHLTSLSSATIKSSRDNAINKGNVPGTTYGNAFNDATKAWGIVYESVEGGPLSISFKFAIQREEFINRITLTHYGDKPQTAIVQTSVDAVNIHDIIEHSSGVVLDSQAKLVSLDFEDKLTEFIHITLKKEDSDSVQDGVHRYIFGLKNVSVYITGRSKTATYVSKPFDFSGSIPAISKVALTASESLSPATSIDWSIGILNSSDELIGDYSPITPQSRVSGQGAPKVLNIQDGIISSSKFKTDENAYVSVLNFQSTTFYKIFELPTEPIFGTASLFRGYKSWSRDSSLAVNPILVKDNYVPFSKGSLQFLYQISQEIILASQVDTKSVLLTRYNPLYDTNKGHTLVPEINTNTITDIQPIYAVYSASLVTDDTRVVIPNASFSTTNILDLGISNIIYEQPGDVELRRSDGIAAKIYVDGVDYIIELNNDGTPSGTIRALTGSELLGYDDPNNPGTTIYPGIHISYNVDLDITRYVSSIKGKQVFFDLNINALPTNQIVIRYRHIANDVIKPSIKAKAYFGIAGDQKIYTQGVDYLFDPITSQIQHLNTGSIAIGDDVYVDYKVNDQSQSLDQFFLWANVNQKGGVSIKLQQDSTDTTGFSNILTPDINRGEQLLASIPQFGLVDLTNAIEWPLMTGWVQFVVRSIPPEDLEDSAQEPLIHQVIKLRDNTNDFIFIDGGKHFSEITGIREPLQQVSFQSLKNNIFKGDNRYFAIRDILIGDSIVYQVIVNFRPNNTDNLYSYSAIGDSYEQGGIDGIYPISEEWKIRWTSREDSLNSGSKVVVRAILNRDEDITDGNITPKVFSYFIKVLN